MTDLARWCAFFAANAAWQISLFAGVLAALAIVLKKAAARWRYRLWLSGVLLSVCVPLLTTYLALHPVRTSSSRVLDVAADRWTTPHPPEHGRLTMHFTAIPANDPTWNLFGIICICLGCSYAVGAAKLFWQLRRIRQIVRSSQELACVHEQSHILRANTSPAKLLLCADIHVPVTVSWWTPMILVPPSFQAMSDQDRAALVAHELAHVRRRDFESNLFLEVLTQLVSFHPLIHWMKRKVAECREEICDEIAAEETVGRASYARFLLSMSRRTEQSSGFRLALGVSHTELERRIIALLDPVRKPAHYSSFAFTLGLSALLTVSASALFCGLHPTSVQAAGAPAFAFDPSQTFDALKPKSERKQAPDFTLIDNKGKPITLSAYKGKVVLLDFWATWCGGCKLEIPWYMQFDQQYRKDGLAAIGVSMDEKGWEAVRPFLAKKRDAETGGMIAMQYPIVIGNDALAQRFGMTSMPMTLLIDKDGRIAVSHTGVVDKDNFESNIKKLLKE